MRPFSPVPDAQRVEDLVPVHLSGIVRRYTRKSAHETAPLTTVSSWPARFNSISTVEIII